MCCDVRYIHVSPLADERGGFRLRHYTESITILILLGIDYRVLTPRWIAVRSGAKLYLFDV
jgi:hypothetical protein